MNAYPDLSTRCCIVGGGPAGLMLGLLLAQAGVEVVVLEKHNDFIRDFRGDTIHPSTMTILHEIGLLEEFLELPHIKAPKAWGRFGGSEPLVINDFSTLPVVTPYIAFLPQWDFLDFLAGHASANPGFALHMGTRVGALLRDGERVTGVRAVGPSGKVTIHADLVIGADGRDSTIRRLADMPLVELGVPIDALVFRVPRDSTDPDRVLVSYGARHHILIANRGEYWQCLRSIPKDGFDAIRALGLEAFREEVHQLLGPRSPTTDAMPRDWEDVKLLTVRIDHLARWHLPGLLCIGDAAHAMSPIGGVGVNLAIHDAVATANTVVAPLLAGSLSRSHLHAVQRRRLLPARIYQRLQAKTHTAIDQRLRNPDRPEHTERPPRAARLIDRHRTLRRIPAQLFGIGIRPEHVRTAAIRSERRRNRRNPSSKGFSRVSRMLIDRRPER